MAIEVTVKKTDFRTVAFVHRKAHFNEIPQAMGQLYGWIQQKGYVPAGPPIGVYFNSPQQVPPDELVWEIHAPIAGDVAPGGPDEQGIGVKTVEGVEVASAMHKGPFDQVGPVYAELFQWLTDNGYELAGPTEEVYLSDPGTTAPEELLTEIRFPVKKR